MFIACCWNSFFILKCLDVGIHSDVCCLLVLAICGIGEFECCASSALPFTIIVHWGAVRRLFAHQAIGSIQKYLSRVTNCLGGLVATFRYGAEWNFWYFGRFVKLSLSLQEITLKTMFAYIFTGSWLCKKRDKNEWNVFLQSTH